MSDRNTPTEVKGGRGFDFEDFVAAGYLSEILVGGAPLDADCGVVTSIDWQVPEDEWHLDDILLTFDRGDGVTPRCACSVKSNAQFTSKRAPPDFVRACWEQLLRQRSDAFDPDKDFLALFTGSQSARTSQSLQQILGKARSKDSETLFREFSGAQRVAKATKELFFSFRCPKDLCGDEQVDDNQIGRLLARIVVKDYDFLDATSRSVDHALAKCRDALDSGHITDAQRLWKDLLNLAKKHRSPGGLLDRATLVNALRSKHRLKDYPWHDADWVRLDRLTRDRVDAIPCKIGNAVALERRDALEQLEHEFRENRCVVLVGASGVGKTVLARHWATAQARKRVLWIDAETLARTDWGAVESQLRLDHSLANLLAGMSDSEALVVLDGMEKLVSSEAFSRIALLFRWAGMGDPASPWRILGTCVTDQWRRVQKRLVRADILGNEFQECGVEALKGQDIKAVWEEFPSLRRLTLTPHLGSLLCLPKVLDLLASNVRSGSEVNTSRWVGESDLIRWFWQEKVEDTESAAQRSACMQALAMQQADRGEHTTALTDSSNWAGVIDQLVKERLCHLADDCVGFQHDLFADWARQRVILGKGNETREFLEPRITKPHWHRAIRLYGLHLLEQHDGLERWRTAFQELPFAQDLLLEAAVYASNPFGVLERLREELVANGGGLLRRLLGRFLHVATTPLTEDPEEPPDISAISRAWIRASHRHPYPMLWFPVLQWLYQHRDEVVDVAPLEVAKITGMWLEKVPTNWLLCREAAELAITIGEQTYRSRLSRPYRDDEDDQAKYRAALLAATELPDRVTQFARKACSRDLPEEVLTGEVGDYKPPGTQLDREGVLSQFTITVPDPWPDGPRCRVDRAFRDTCLETDALQRIMECRPAVAREILLASVIEYRVSDRSGGFADSVLGIDGIEDNHFFSPPVYFRGPFLPFLQCNPQEAIETVVRLVNFATERWAQQIKRSRYATATAHYISIGEGNHSCVGNVEVFHWHRGFTCHSNIVVTALVVLEKWLYNKLEAGESINHEIAQILATSRSAALAGLLIEVGKSQAALFQGALRDLLVVPEFYAWEADYRAHGYGSFGPPLETRFGEWFFDLQKEWATLPHRERHLAGVATELYRMDTKVHDQLCSARDAWLARRVDEENALIATILDQLCVTFNSENWETDTDADGHAVLVFRPPQAPQSAKTATSDNSDQRVANYIRFAMDCRQILDKRQPLAGDKIEQFWSFLSRFADSGEETPEDEHRRRDALCGGAAVLLLLHGEWLAKQPDRDQFCLGILLNATSNPPLRTFPDVPDSIGDYQWDHFCAEVAPRIWADDPDSPDIRRWIALLATSFHYRTVGILMESAFRIRDRLKSGFGQLQHFVLRAAAARWEATSEIRTHFQKTAFDYQAWWNEYAMAFIENRIEPAPPPWNELWLSEPPLWYARDRHGRDEDTYAYVPPIDGIMVQHAFEWIRSIDDARDENEQRRWIEFWKEAVKCSLGLTTYYDREGRLIDNPHCNAGFPFKFDQWVLECVAEIVPLIEDDEAAQELWEPIIRLGRHGAHWVDRFLSQWVRTVLRCDEPARTVGRWRDMSALARSLPGWTDRRPHWGSGSDDLPCNLLGVGQFMADSWEPQHREIVSQLAEEFRGWKEHLLVDPYVAIHFVYWLARPAAEPIALEGLAWLWERVDSAGEYWWSNEYLPDQVVRLLVHCWDSCRQQLVKDDAAHSAFRKLLKALADSQHPVAMDLLDRIAEDE